MRVPSAIALGLVLGCSSGQVGVPDAGVLPDMGPQQDLGEPEISSAGLQVLAVEPSHGPFTGGSQVIVRGTEFTADLVVRFDGRMVEPLWQQWLDPTRFLVITTAGEPGPADVTVEDLPEEGPPTISATLEGGFVYDSFYVDPASGTTLGGTFVKIKGQGTSFDASSTVTIGGSPLQNITVVSANEIEGFTPPGEEGTADVVVGTAVGDIEVRDAYNYFRGVSLGQGGLGGGELEEALNVTVVDYQSGASIPGAYVMVGSDPATPYQGVTDALGVIAFTGTFTPPIDLTAGAEGYESTTFVSFDAREAVIRLIPLPPPPTPGPPPPGILGSYLRGVIQFGGPSGIGTEVWTLVPEPQTETQYKCARIRASVPNLYVPQPYPGAEADVTYVPDQSSWEFSLFVRPGTMAVYALAGICDDAFTPPSFEAYAMGIRRGVLAGPGEVVDTDIVIDIPLDTPMDVTLDAPPPLRVDYYGFRPTRHFLYVGIDLGGDGIIMRWDTPVIFQDGNPLQVVMPNHTQLVGPALSDATYVLVAGAESGSGPLDWPEATDDDQDGGDLADNPFSVVIKKGVTNILSPVVIDGFLGIPQPSDPTPGGFITNRHIEWTHAGAPPGVLTMVVLSEPGAFGNIPVWRLFVEGSQTAADIPDLTAIAGLPDMPSLLQWDTWNITPAAGEDYDFDQFAYRDAMSLFYWEAYAVDAYFVNYLP